VTICAMVYLPRIILLFFNTADSWL